MSVLPSTAYAAPPRLGRGRQLNTIVEEKEDASQGVKSDSEGDGSDSTSTVIGYPATWNPQLYTAAPPRKSSLATTTTVADSPVSSCPSSPLPSSAGEGHRKPASVRSSYSSDSSGTVFSDDGSLSSDPTSFASESSRNSCGSNRSGRNRYPALLIPRGSWGALQGSSPVKEIGLGMSPATKIRLSPGALSALPRCVPEASAPPSLGDSNSTTSDFPDHQGISAPVTPEIKQLEIDHSESWGGPAPVNLLTQHLEIALGDDHSVILSPAEAHSANASSSSIMSPVWTDMVVNFPQVPGATPQDRSPLMPTMDEIKKLDEVNLRSNGSDQGVRLPPDALRTLQRLTTHQRSPDEISFMSGGSRPSKRSGTKEEMRQLTDPSPVSRPRSAEGQTPISDYSFSQLSIPSPGGFFSSLRSGARHTWCLNKSKESSVPNTATAEKFYNRPWDTPSPEEATDSNVVETVLAIEDTNMTEGPPTARQATFTQVGASRPEPKRAHSPSEDSDLYGPGPDPGPDVGVKTETVLVGFEYDEKYQEELKAAANQNIDRTGSWLAAQTGYLSTLLGFEPDFGPHTEPVPPEESADQQNVKASDSAAAVAEVVQPASTAQEVKPTDTSTSAIIDGPELESPGSEPEAKEPVFLTAFQYLLSNRKRRDAFIQAGPRLEAIQAARVAIPEEHVKNIFGQHVLVEPVRPKYAGPFNQNPRATGVFERTAEQIAYKTAEKQQLALASIEPCNWQIEALKAIYRGRLLASAAACHRLTTKSTIPLDDPSCVGNKRLRILDFGGSSTASWAWHAALEWPNVKVYTVITKEQATWQRPAGQIKPEGPQNHRTVSVPHLWQLPFRNGHFDVISARSLHALLRHNPVPGVPEIDEWDLALRECLRVLKPGGYLDYVVMDSAIAHAGPCGSKLSDEFGSELRRRGYEREAGRSFLRRLKKEGYVGVKRAWMFLPMGRRPRPQEDADQHVHGYTGGWQSWRQGAKPFVPTPRPISEVSTISKIVKQYMDVEAVQGPVGSTQDVADLTGLLGARMYEEWLVRVRAEAGIARHKWLDGVDEVIEEGREKGSGWMVLVGWARKPKPKVEPKVEPKVRLEARQEARPEVKTEMRPKVRPEVRPEVNREARPEVKSGVRLQVKPNSKPKSVSKDRNNDRDMDEQKYKLVNRLDRAEISVALGMETFDGHAEEAKIMFSDDGEYDEAQQEMGTIPMVIQG
ncbi:hypothetical protein HRR83_003762 [Exophiala dermatitidis]|uniref:Methyltransferase type 11 domain-containing protein n=2 Tax=Exophiala dermatitidis TaxID=5970 RepID=H6BPA0_EXODN|nr:uncharacterized protein HMPREF1120_01744 [Exophiala dermatitidis NIH/UT8656]KAJ4518937.1 hypothetical protein HRR75_002613 [Exophiala dermatitidis]EHY53555.1 hypothetical protein HMPREF1120_01744 [Exophiala dermatitidis NIH/UT8656]KAJ4522273.1 hypothetical protein HRR74_002856 [Exophiala dermatitidis]KAJ4529598.1 hypothetical protein HRR73_000624 [Exophiala dermatitidis]KAJ4543239.1 hypothetical protein HRR77_005495 [Exophiala dermatitidis]